VDYTLKGSAGGGCAVCFGLKMTSGQRLTTVLQLRLAWQTVAAT
jgi:hypothetical protein